MALVIRKENGVVPEVHRAWVRVLQVQQFPAKVGQESVSKPEHGGGLQRFHFHSFMGACPFLDAGVIRTQDSANGVVFRQVLLVDLA
jgi:hypothetical protein